METIDQLIEPRVVHFPRGLAIRGVIAIAFGVLMLVWPGITLATLILLIGALAAVDGVASLLLAFSVMPVSHRWWYVLSGIAGLAVGVFAYASPGISALALLYVVGAWAIVIGALQFAEAAATAVDGRHRALLVLYGIVAVVFGAIMILRPGDGAIALVALIAAYAIISGVTLIVAASEFQKTANKVRETITAMAA
jgi:uncharacterized membrane protein HdeD (DUF308 family)